MKKIYSFFLIIGLIAFTGVSIHFIVIEEIRLWNTYEVEYQKLLDECEARAPENSICLVDYMPINHFCIFLAPLIFLSWIGVFGAFIFEEKEEIK